MRQAFSLVELSIVLVILGLLTGGILAGQSLIRASELRSITNDFTRYTTAVYSFRSKYNALPGDITNASAFWGAADGNDGTGADCIAVVSTTGATCNGNGDGNISEATATTVEIYRAWQQLANAGLIEGSYTGVNGPGGSNWSSVIGTNIPATRISNGGFAIHSGFSATANANYFDGTYKIRLMVGSSTPNNTVSSPLLRPEEVWGIDTKMDDGKPGYGIIQNLKSTAASTPGCTTTDIRSTAEYSLTNSAILCNIIGQPGF